MFKSKIAISVTVFVFFLIITSTIKNQTRIIEKQINQLNKKISLKEKDLNESQFDFYYLTSPILIEKKIKNLGYNHYLPMEHSKIFLNFLNFNNIQNKITILKNQHEEEIKKK
jgi:lipopolysaccharide export LptBFGC system permease protein LptF|tara:strand:+ start:1877 stop:2215 length:339 start_codon:yes stop_codon:yes gene_type:complete